MSFAITQSCCVDASCVSACPVNCIHPAPGEPGFGSADILHIDPDTCIDCGACVPACPVEAIFAAEEVPDKWKDYTQKNTAYYQK